MKLAETAEHNAIVVDDLIDDFVPVDNAGSSGYGRHPFEAFGEWMPVVVNTSAKVSQL